MLNGDAPHLETYLLNRLYGKPREHVSLEVSLGAGGEDLSTLSTFELQKRAIALIDELQEVAELEEAIPAEFRIIEAAKDDEKP